MAFYNRDDTYLAELEEKLQKDRDYRAFAEDFKGFETAEIIQMYTVKISNELYQSPNEEITKEDKVLTLESRGEFLTKMTALDEMKKIYNNDVLYKTKDSLGDETKNPLIVTKKEMKREFAAEANEKIEEPVLDMKLSFWENRITKTLESVKTSSIAGYSKLYKKDDKFVTKNLKALGISVAIDNPNYMDKYNEFLNKKITKEEFEKTQEYKNMQKIIANNEERTGLKYTPYMLFNMSAINQQISKGYMNKNIFVRNALEKSDKNMICNAYVDNDPIRNKFLAIGMTEKEYNLEVNVHVRKTDFDVYKDDVDITINEISSTRPPIKGTLLHKFSPHKLEALKEAIGKKKMYDSYTQQILSHYENLLNGTKEVVIEEKAEEKEEVEKTQKEKFTEELQSKCTPRSERNNNNKGYYNRSRTYRKNKDNHERGGR